MFPYVQGTTVISKLLASFLCTESSTFDARCLSTRSIAFRPRHQEENLGVAVSVTKGVNVQWRIDTISTSISSANRSAETVLLLGYAGPRGSLNERGTGERATINWTRGAQTANDCAIPSGDSDLIQDSRNLLPFPKSIRDLYGSQ